MATSYRDAAAQWQQAVNAAQQSWAALMAVLPSGDLATIKAASATFDAAYQVLRTLATSPVQ